MTSFKILFLIIPVVIMNCKTREQMVKIDTTTLFLSWMRIIINIRWLEALPISIYGSFAGHLKCRRKPAKCLFQKPWTGDLIL